jgi:tetraacyldisaccharide 4'-kinase
MTASEAGDEVFLLAKSLPGVPVIIGRNRAITGDYAVSKLGADVIILDDAYQHWRLARDLDIVLIDTINVFGNNCMLPRGTLREPLRHLNRAHAFLLTKVDQSAPAAREALRDKLFHYNEQALIMESVHNPRNLMEIAEWYSGTLSAAVDLEALKDRPVVAFSAIGNPASFEQTVADVGAKVVDAVRFPDHHDYGLSEMQYIMQKAVDKGASALITTEKDAVKIPPEFIHSARALPLYILGIEMKFLDGNDELLALIKNTVTNKQAGAEVRQ